MAKTALADPKAGLARRIQRREALARHGAPMDAKGSNPKIEVRQDTIYTANWSGGILAPPASQAFAAVSGTFPVPKPAVPQGVTSTDNQWAASAWVGIDGDTYADAILQTGVDFSVDSSGNVVYTAWYEWFPDYSYDFTLAIKAGDIIKATVRAPTTTTGIATIENLTTGKSASMSLKSTTALAGLNAEWIVEDYQAGSDLVAFANFGHITFSNCVAATAKSREGVSSYTVLDIEDDAGAVLTDVKLISDSSFEVDYTGPQASVMGSAKIHGPHFNSAKLKAGIRQNVHSGGHSHK